MSWKSELGDQIRGARKARGLSQQGLANKISITREQISNIEKGKSAPAVNIVTEISKALDVPFMVEGLQVGGTNFTDRLVNEAPIAMQLSLSFETNHRFEATSVKLDSVDDRDILLSFHISRLKSA